MNKIIALLLVLLLTLGITGCSNNTNTEDPGDVINQEDLMDLDEGEEGDTDANKDPYVEDEIELSVSMTKGEIVDLLGGDYAIRNTVDGMYDTNLTTIEYQGISFEFSHDGEDVPSDASPSHIEITSVQYKYDKADFIGYNALEAIEACDNNFENVINIHAEEGDEELPDWFNYDVRSSKGGPYVLAFQYNTGERYFSKENIPQDAVITAIQFWGHID